MGAKTAAELGVTRPAERPNGRIPYFLRSASERPWDLADQWDVNRTPRTLCALTLLFGGAAALAPAVSSIGVMLEPVSAVSLPFRGRAFPMERLAAPFRRIPSAAESQLSPAAQLAGRHSAGLALRLFTSAGELSVQWDLAEGPLEHPDLARSAAAGLDLYLREGESWVPVTVAVPEDNVGNYALLYSGLSSEPREWLLYLPLAAELDDLTFELPPGESLTPATSEMLDEFPYRAPVVYYGGRLAQGYGASRPGRAAGAVLGRAVDREVINLGLGEGGQLDLAAGALLAEINAAAFVIDCMDVASADTIRDRLPNFVRGLRQARPESPIILVEERPWDAERFHPHLAAEREERRQAMRSAFNSLMDRGTTALYHVRGETLGAGKGDERADAWTLNDLGHKRHGEVLAAFLGPLIEE